MNDKSKCKVIVLNKANSNIRENSVQAVNVLRKKEDPFEKLMDRIYNRPLIQPVE